jgi:hypothetical protein
MRARDLLRELGRVDVATLADRLHRAGVPLLAQRVSFGVSDRRFGRLVRLRHAVEQLFHGVGLDERRDMPGDRAYAERR